MPRGEGKATEYSLALGGRIRQARAVAGLNQKELGTRSNYDPVSISRIESGLMLPGIEGIQRLAIALGVSIDSIVPKPVSFMLPTTGDGTEESSDSALAALGGQALTEIVADLRSRVERLERLERKAGVDPPAAQKRAAR